jgi:hypothetical protein
MLKDSIKSPVFTDGFQFIYLLRATEGSCGVGALAKSHRRRFREQEEEGLVTKHLLRAGGGGFWWCLN